MLDPCYIVTPNVNKVLQFMNIKLVILNNLAGSLVYLECKHMNARTAWSQFSSF